MSNKQNIWALQLIRYLVVTKGYYQANVITNYQPIEKRVDYWLIDPESDVWTIVHISDESDSERNQTLEITRGSSAKILELVGRTNGTVLDISLSDMASNYKSGNITYISIFPYSQLPDEVANEFPDLTKVMHDLEGNYDENVKKLEKQVKLAAISAMQVRMRKKPKEKISLKNALSKSFKIISVICVLITLFINIVPLFTDFKAMDIAIMMGAYYKAFITVMGEYWRFFTSGFIHIDIWHLLANMYAFSYVSKKCEDYFGTWKTIAILFVAIIIGNICVFIGDKNIVAVGLSGGIYGLVGALVVVAIQRHWFKSDAFRREFFRNVYINLFISLLPNVSFLAHLGGFVAGIFLGFILSKETDKFLKYNFIACGLLVVCALGYLCVINSSFMDFYYGTDLAVANIAKNIGLNNYSNRIMDNCYKYYVSHGGY